MPKLKKRIEEPEKEEEDELEDEEDEESQFEEDELEKDPAPLETKEKGIKKAPVEPKEPKRRFGVVPSQPIRLIDAETNEVVGEGDHLIATALADILERLERIETNIGSMMEG